MTVEACRGRDAVQERVPQDDVGQGRARLALPRKEIRRAAAVLPAALVDLSADADLPGFRPAHHLDLRRLTSNDGSPPLEMHPDDARARNLQDGQSVRVWNELGEVRLPLRITEISPEASSHAQGRVVHDDRQRPDHLGAVPRPPRRHLRGRLLQRRAGRSGGDL